MAHYSGITPEQFDVHITRSFERRSTLVYISYKPLGAEYCIALSDSYTMDDYWLDRYIRSAVDGFIQQIKLQVH